MISTYCWSECLVKVLFEQACLQCLHVYISIKVPLNSFFVITYYILIFS